MIFLFLVVGCDPSKDESAPPDDTHTPIGDSDSTGSDDSTPPDLDQDDDGYPTPDDCDDDDPDVNPGAAEVAGNGVDDNCDGINLPDADGDGHGDADFGGDDCDDTSAWVYPGATEYCDPIDQDCDGEPLVAGGCAGLQEPRAWASTVFVDNSAGELAIGDLSGDGRHELLVGSGSQSFEIDGEVIYPAFAVYDWTSLAEIPRVPPDRAAQVFTAPGGRAWGSVDAGDVTGDGVRDLTIFATFTYEAFVLPGPLPLDGTVLDASDSGLSWVPDFFYSESWCEDVALGGDLDADGVNDVLCDSAASYGEEPDGMLQMYRGGEFGGEHSTSAYLGHYVFTPTTLPDLTGDGANEMAVTKGTDTVLIVDGSELATGGEVTASAISEIAFAGTLNGSGDRTGDGVPDLLVGDDDAKFLGYDHGAVYLVDGTLTGEIEPEQSVGCWVGNAEGVQVREGKDIDLDGDGDIESWLQATLEGSWVTLVTPAPQPTWGEDATLWGLALDEAYVRRNNQRSSIDSAPGDDLPFVPNNDGDENDVTYLYSGWAVPWFDPVYWPQ